MSVTILPKLEEIVEDIVAQEAVVTEQLAEVQAKLESIRAVLPLFGEDAEPVAKSTRAKKAPAAKAKTAKAKTAKAKTAKATASTKTTATKSTTKTTTKQKSKKKDGRAATWQKYTRAGVGKQPMPEAVRLILSTQPDKDFKIAEVMSSLFKDEMPKSQYLKARNRISNILSGGVRNGDWYKGDRGAYRLTDKA